MEKTFRIRYRASVVLLTEDGKFSFVPVRIEKFNIDCDYSKHVTPLLTLNLMLNSATVQVIKNNEERMLLHCRLEKIKYSANFALNDRDDQETTLVFDNMFVPIFEQEDFKSIRQTIDETKKESPEDTFNDGPDRNMIHYSIRIYANTIRYHNFYKKMYNGILRSEKLGEKITIPSVLKYVCETSGNDGYIIDVPDNSAIEYDHVLLPPGNVIYTIDALQLNYGIYLKDILRFYGLDNKLYVLSRLATKHSYEKDKPKICRLSVETEKTNVSGYTTYLDNNIIQMKTVGGVEDSNISIASGEAYGDSIVFTNFGISNEPFIFDKNEFKGANSTTREFLRSSLSHRNSGTNIVFEYDELNNNFNIFSVLEANSLTSFFIVSTEGADIDCFNPNVLFTISVDSTNENDNIRFKNKKFPLLNYSISFTRDNDINTDDIFLSSEQYMLGAVQ